MDCAALSGASSLSVRPRLHHQSLGSSKCQPSGSRVLPRVVRAAVQGASASSQRTRQPVSVRADQLASGSQGTSPEHTPAAPFYKIEAVLRPWRIKFVCRALIEQGIRGVTVVDVRGFGAQGGSRERQAGSEFADDSLVHKSKLEVVVVADQVEDVIETIINEARTGEIGDGKIFVSPVSEVIRVRTGERGVDAERMAGGRQELLEKPHVYVSPDGKEML